MLTFFVAAGRIITAPCVNGAMVCPAIVTQCPPLLSTVTVCAKNVNVEVVGFALAELIVKHVLNAFDCSSCASGDPGLSGTGSESNVNVVGLPLALTKIPIGGIVS